LQKFLINVEVCSVPGSHYDMIDAHVATTAAELFQLIESARIDLVGDHTGNSG
jgi:hypothetical protein